jgi:poly(3-hydroxybutyrate) depolymerase
MQLCDLSLPDDYPPLVSRRARVGPVIVVHLCREATGLEARGLSRLRFNATSPSQTTSTGADVLTGAGDRRAYLHVPPTYRASAPAPLVIAFHGAGGRGTDWMGPYATRTGNAGMILLAPDSLGLTWDAVGGDFGEEAGAERWGHAVILRKPERSDRAMRSS